MLVKKVNNIDFFYFILSLLLLSASLVFNSGTISSISISLCNILFIIKFKNNLPILFLFLFLLTYSLTFNYYFLYDIGLSVWDDFQNDYYIHKVLKIQLIFLFVIGNLITHNTLNNIQDRIKYFFRPDKLKYFIALILCFISLYFGASGETMFESGVYYSESSRKSALHEYFILFYCFLLFYKPNNKTFHIINISLALIFCIKTLLYGGRIEILQIGLLIIISNYKLKIKHVVVFSLLGIYSLNVISNVRNNPVSVLENNYKYIFSIKAFGNDRPSLNKGHIDSNQGDVIQSSARILGLIENDEIDISVSLKSFFSNVFSILTPNSVKSDYYNLATYKQDYYRSGGGGFISIYFYTWLGFFGLLIIPFILSYFLRKIFTTNSRTLFIYSFFLLFTFPRWISYNPIHLFRFCVFAIIFYLILVITNQLYKIFIRTNDIIKL